jgi:predicted DNA-binding WGR domain protein
VVKGNVLTIQSGKVGTAGNTETKTFGDAAAADREAASLLTRVKMGAVKVETR